MPKYKFWYQKEIKAKNLEMALRVEKKVKPAFHSIEEVEDRSDRDLHPLIGFQINTESDYWEE